MICKNLIPSRKYFLCRICALTAGKSSSKRTFSSGKLDFALRCLKERPFCWRHYIPFTRCTINWWTKEFSQFTLHFHNFIVIHVEKEVTKDIARWTARILAERHSHLNAIIKAISFRMLNGSKCNDGKAFLKDEKSPLKKLPFSQPVVGRWRYPAAKPASWILLPNRVRISCGELRRFKDMVGWLEPFEFSLTLPVK